MLDTPCDQFITFSNLFIAVLSLFETTLPANSIQKLIGQYQQQSKHQYAWDIRVNPA